MQTQTAGLNRGMVANLDKTKSGVSLNSKTKKRLAKVDSFADIAQALLAKNQIQAAEHPPKRPQQPNGSDLGQPAAMTNTMPIAVLRPRDGALKSDSLIPVGADSHHAKQAVRPDGMGDVQKNAIDESKLMKLDGGTTPERRLAGNQGITANADRVQNAVPKGDSSERIETFLYNRGINHDYPHKLRGNNLHGNADAIDNGSKLAPQNPGNRPQVSLSPSKTWNDNWKTAGPSPKTEPNAKPGDISKELRPASSGGKEAKKVVNQEKPVDPTVFLSTNQEVSREVHNSTEVQVEKNGMSKNQADWLVNKLVQQIKVAPSSLEISLKPEYMGKINILVQNSKGGLTVSMITHNSEALNVLQSNLQTIKDGLDQQGVNVQQLEINLANQGNLGNAGSGNHGGTMAGRIFANHDPNPEAGELEVWEQGFKSTNELNVLV